MKTIKKINSVFILFAILLSCEKDNDEVSFNNNEIPLNIQVSNPINEYQPNETTIAINRSNPLNIVAGANRKYYYYSFDGGNTWTQNELSTPLGALCDPCVKFDNNGNAYYSHLAQVEGEIIADRMVVQKSVDGGITWNNGVGFEKNGKYHDREWMCIDNTNSSFQNNIYVTWTQYDALYTDDSQYKSTILCAYSSDQGDTWTKARTVSDVLGDCSDTDKSLQAAKPAIGPDGEVYVCWSGNYKIYFDKSLDGGNTFGTDIEITQQYAGWDFPIDGLSRADGCPSLACDISHTKYRGNLYLLWSDIRNGISNTDIFFKKSTDGGVTWSETKHVNDDNTQRQQFFPSMTVDPITGYIYIVFYDRRETVGSATDVYLARSTNGGETFKNYKISEESFTPPDVFIGDYIDIAAYDGKVYPIWTKATIETRSIIVALIDDNQ